MIRNKLYFFAGPIDGWVVPEDPSFLEHYYIPIEGSRYHYYRRSGCTNYLYQGEVEVVSTG